MYVRYGHDNIPLMEARLNVLMKRFPWVEMVVFSELCAFGPSLEHAQTLPGPAEERFQALAARHRIWLLPGSLFEKDGDRVFNTCPVIDPSGNVIRRYRKMFPFRPYERDVTGGSEFVTFDVPEVGRFGVSICYDMWFPETTRTMAAMGAEVILHPSLTDTIDRDVELAIARASAATNQCFFLDVNGVGQGGNGRTVVVRPTGTVIYTAGSGEEVIPVDLDLNNAQRGRETGLFGLGQVLKSFRDREVEFTVYDRSGPGKEFLDSLGPLVTPERKERNHGNDV
jgi:predicted amidohydrolase